MFSEFDIKKHTVGRLMRFWVRLFGSRVVIYSRDNTKKILTAVYVYRDKYYILGEQVDYDDENQWKSA